MSRLLPLLLALMVAPAVVSIAVAPQTICQERCPDDGPDGRCPPVCPSCIPTGHAVSAAYVATGPAPAIRSESFSVSAARQPGDPDPHDIFHVPKRSLA